MGWKQAENDGAQRPDERKNTADFCGLWAMSVDAGGRKVGAGSGNRTRIASLEGWCFTTKLYPRCIGLCHAVRLSVNRACLALRRFTGYCYNI